MPRHPEPFADTDPKALAVWREVLGAETEGERMLMALELSDFAFRMAESGVRERFPGASEREVFLRAAALRA